VHEKRAHTRVPIDADARCETDDGHVISGVAKDISIGGMFIETEETPSFGTRVTVVTRLPGLDAEVRLPGVVRWSKPDGIGIQFGLLGARETHAITLLLKH
jgi:Tfp pilus assembly protein PilZ